MELLDLIEKHIQNRSKTVREVSLKIIKHRIKLFSDFLTMNNVTTLSDLNVEVIRNYKLSVEFKRFTPGGQYMELYEARRFLAFLFQEAYTLIDLSEELPLPKQSAPDIPQLSTKQAIQLIENLDSHDEYLSRDKAMAALFLFEKLHRDHLHELTLLDLDLEDSQIRIARKKKFIKIQPESLKYLRAYLRTRPQLKPVTDWVFIDKYGKRIAFHTLKNFIRKVKRCRIIWSS